MFKNKKKYTCAFCNDLTKISTSKLTFCRDCNKIRSYIRDYGLQTLLSKITQNEMIPASCPPNYPK